MAIENFKVSVTRATDDFYNEATPKVDYYYGDLDECCFVSGLISNEVITSWTSKTPVLIACQTGRGKTSFVREAIFPLAHANNEQILILGNRTALVRQLKRDVAKELANNYGLQQPSEMISNVTDTGLDKINDLGFVTVLTYQSLLELDPATLAERNFRYVIADEIHFLTSDSEFNAQTGKIHSFILEHWGNAIRIYLTATPDVVFEPLFRAENEHALKTKYDLIDKYRQRIMLDAMTVKPGYQDAAYKLCNAPEKVDMKVYDLQRDYSYVSQIVLLDSLSDDKKVNLLCDMVKTLPKSDKALIFVGSKNLGYKMVSAMNGAGIPASFINADVKEGQAFSEVVTKERFGSQVLVSTAVLDNGANVHDSAVRHIIIDAYDKVAFVQMLGRVRIRKGNKVKLYVFDRSVESLQSMLVSAQWALAKRLILDSQKAGGKFVSDESLIVDGKKGFGFDESGIYYSKFSLYQLLFRISNLRRVIRLHKQDAEYFPDVYDDKAEPVFAGCRNLCKNYPTLGKRLRDALTTKNSYEFEKRQAERNGRVLRPFQNDNSFERFILRKKLTILRNRIKNEGFTTDLVSRCSNIERLLVLLADVPSDKVIQAGPPDVGYIAAEYANFLGVSPDGIKPYNGVASIDMPSEPVEASGNEDNTNGDILSLIDSLVASKSQYELHIKSGKYSPDSWPWVEQHGFPSTLSKIDEKHPFARLIERLIRRYNVTTKAIIGKFNEDPEFKRWIMVKAECSAKGAKHPVHYVMIER